MVHKFRSPTFKETPTHMHTKQGKFDPEINRIPSLPKLGMYRKSTPIYGHPSPLLSATPGDKGAIFRQVCDSTCQSE